MPAKKGTYKREEVVKIPYNHRPLSEMQQAIADRWIGGFCNIHADARAGSGKSSTQVALMHLDPDKSPGVYIAFNREIVAEMAPKVPNWIEVKTAHGYGYRAIQNDQNRRLQLLENKVINIIQERGVFSGGKKWPRELALAKIIGEMKRQLIDPSNQDGFLSLLDGGDIKWEDDHISAMLSHVPKIFSRIVEECENGLIDYDDMIWYPIYANLSFPQYDRIFIDEAQDLSILLRKVAGKMVGGKVMTVGDEAQSIYRFMGADSQSIPELVKMFNSERMPLSVCYRCPKKVIEEAQKLVPDIQWADGAIDGEVQSSYYFDPDLIHPDALVISRKNSTLFKYIFRMIKEGKKASVKGQDVIGSLQKLMKDMNLLNVSRIEAEEKIHAYREESIKRIQARARPSESAIAAVNDKMDSLLAVAEGCRGFEDAYDKLEILKNQRGGIVFSSIHRSKGLEADHIVLLDHSNIRLNHKNMDAEDLQQEKNCEYVAKTRAKKSMVMIQVNEDAPNDEDEEE